MKLKKKFKIEGMHCSSCAITIDMDLEDLDGVGKAQTSYAKSETEIEFDEEKPRTEHICTTYKDAIERGELSGS